METRRIKIECIFDHQYDMINFLNKVGTKLSKAEVEKEHVMEPLYGGTRALQ